MKLPQLKKIAWNYSALAFAFPFFGMLFVMLVSGYSPFGSASMLYSDSFHQYYPFYVAFRDALRSGDSLLYSWNVGLGMDYLGLIAYYLASPLYLFTVFLPESWLLPFFSLLTPIKLGFAGLFFFLFLKKLFQKEELTTVLFSAFYATCAWTLAYQWNIMWLDTFALMPLSALGTILLLKDRKCILYTAALFLSIFCNYYIGFFTCIFILLIFICYQICNWKSFRRFFADLGWIAVFSILAIGMTAILELPALASLKNTQSRINQFPQTFRLNIATQHTWQGLLDAMRQVLGNTNGGLEPSFKEGLPNLYCGVITTILSFLFLTCKNIKLREKFCCVFLLLFFNLSFIIRQLDYIWHGFHFTNMIPYRFSFLYSFVLLYMAYRAWLQRRTFRLWQILIAGVGTIGIVLCSGEFYQFWNLLIGRTSLEGKSPLTIFGLLSFPTYNAVFLLLYLSALLYTYLRKALPVKRSHELLQEYFEDRRYRKKTGSLLLVCTIFAEFCLNLVNFGISFPGTVTTNYPKGTSDTAAVIQKMEEREADTLFYRAETTHTQTLNDGALNGYRGVSTFTSSANVRVTEFMRVLGYSAKNTYNRYSFEESSPVSNLFLNLKYMIERDGKVEENRYFDDIYQSGMVHLLQNNAYLPLGFLADSALADLSFTVTTNPFHFQNLLLRAATGVPEDVFHPIVGNALEVTSENVELESVSSNGYVNYKATSKGEIIYKFTATQEGFFCIHLDLPKRNSFSVTKNGSKSPLYTESPSLAQMYSVCDVVPGDVIEVKLTCSANENSQMTVQAAIMEDAVFQQGYQLLASCPMELTEFRNTYVSGTIHCNRDGLLYTSIPQDGNWHAIVDGQPAEIVLVGDVMIGLELTEGAHTISFYYKNAAFEWGTIISVLCLLIFLGICIPLYRSKSLKGKYNR